MDIGNFNLFIKMIKEEYRLNDTQLETLTHRMLADDKEFENVWKLYKNKAKSFSGGVDHFKLMLVDLMS